LVKGKGALKLSSAAKFSLKLSNKFDDGRHQDEEEENLIEDLKDTTLMEGVSVSQDEGDLIQDLMNNSWNKEEEWCESFIDSLLSEIIKKTVKQSKARKQKQQKKMAEKSGTCSTNSDINKIDDSNMIEDKMERAQPRIRCRSCQIKHFPYPKFCRWTKERSRESKNPSPLQNIQQFLKKPQSLLLNGY
jgi:hypothetical protein